MAEQKKLTKRTQQLLNKSTREEGMRIEVVGVDPGQKELYTQARAMLTDKISGEHFKHGKPNFKVSKKSTEYRFYSLAKLSLKDEKRKREGTSYGVALNRFNEAGCSLIACSEVPCYVKTSMETLAVRVKELLCIDRKKARFTFFRARQREIDRMAKDLAGRDVTCRKEKKTSENDDGQQSQGPVHREASREKIKDQDSRKREFKRIVFFGKAEFGSGSRGPCPRKALIRALALRAPVILIDEYNTSKCCCCCGEKLKQSVGSRVFRCENQTGVVQSCSVNFINRDVNAAVNIALCGSMQLLGRPRPQHLCRPKTEFRNEDDF